jgi:hypothetical protein
MLDNYIDFLNKSAANDEKLAKHDEYILIFDALHDALKSIDKTLSQYKALESTVHESLIKFNIPRGEITDAENSELKEQLTWAKSLSVSLISIDSGLTRLVENYKESFLADEIYQLKERLVNSLSVEDLHVYDAYIQSCEQDCNVKLVKLHSDWKKLIDGENVKIIQNEVDKVYQIINEGLTFDNLDSSCKKVHELLLIRNGINANKSINFQKFHGVRKEFETDIEKGRYASAIKNLSKSKDLISLMSCIDELESMKVSGFKLKGEIQKKIQESHNSMKANQVKTYIRDLEKFMARIPQENERISKRYIKIFLWLLGIGITAWLVTAFIIPFLVAHWGKILIGIIVIIFLIGAASSD